MNRMFFVAVVGLMAIGATGCATGIEDPQPGPAPVTQSRGTPATPFSAEIPDTTPIDPNAIGGIDTPAADQEFYPPTDDDNSDPIDENVLLPLEVQLEKPING